MVRPATTFPMAVVMLCLAACALPGLRSGTVEARVRAKVGKRVELPRPVYPLRVGPTRRYLVDRLGRPFLIVGDSPQALVVNASPAAADAYLADRAARGFNSVWVNLLCNPSPFAGGRADGTTYDGIPPFTTPWDLSTPNEAYFRRADTVLRLAAKHGINVFLDPIETGGWLDVLRKNGVAKDFAYGQWLGNRYKAFSNIVWFNGNDFQTWRDPAADAVALAVARGIRSTDKRHIHTVELNYFTSGSREDARWTPIVRLDAAYTYYPTYAQVLKEYNRADYVPTFMVEANYEFENDYTGPKTLRRQEYWSLLSGAAGQLYGNKYSWKFIPVRLYANKYMWKFTDGWSNHIDTTGVTQLEHVTRLFSRFPWFELVPDRKHELLTDGFGSFRERGSVNASDYATAARTRDGRLAIAYLPTRRTVTVDLGRLAGKVKAEWYDPAAGRFVGIAGSPFESSGTRIFTPPATNGAGDDDWVLVLTGDPSKNL